LMGSLRDNVREQGHADQQRYALAMNAVKREGVHVYLLELGCDDGTFAYGFAQLGCSVTAVDLDCSTAIRDHPHVNIEYIQQNVEFLDYTEEFDVIHAGEILEHVRNPDRLMDAIRRAAKPNGLIMVSVPNFRHPLHVRTYTLRRFRRLLRRHGIDGTVITIRHDLPRKANSRTERYAVYDGRIAYTRAYSPRWRNLLRGVAGRLSDSRGTAR
jgi:2-polyprenyl-3-methyl-5-hydroxy-6-metoxy-1,4-benzoquinol methylase